MATPARKESIGGLAIGPAGRPGRPAAQEVSQSVRLEIDASRLLARGDFWEAADVQTRMMV